MNAVPNKKREATFAGYVDLDKEPLLLHGKEYDEAAAEQLAYDALEMAGLGGRPSLTGQRQHSPQIGLRVTPQTREKLRARAAKEHKTVSDVIGDAVDHYV